MTQQGRSGLMKNVEMAVRVEPRESDVQARSIYTLRGVGCVLRHPFV
ncbi:hypothetical protein AB0M02_27675 [Actinoplanes sp. NPDC051861]